MNGGNDGPEQACEFYVKAGNCFKVAQKWEKAGNAFCSSAKLKSNGEHRHEAATNYVDAALCYLKIDYEQAIECYRRAVEIYVDMGRFSIAAKHLTTAAEIYETKVAHDVIRFITRDLKVLVFAPTKICFPIFF